MTPEIQAQLDLIKAPFQAVMDAANAVPALVDAEVAAFGAAEFARGQASIIIADPANPDNLYTQAQMDAAFVQAKGEQLAADQVQIDSLGEALSASHLDVAAMKAQVDALQSEMDLKVQAGIDAGVESFKAASRALYDSSKIDDIEYRKTLEPKA